MQKICKSDDLQLPDVALARTSTGCSLSRTDGDELRNSSAWVNSGIMHKNLHI